MIICPVSTLRKDIYIYIYIYTACGLLLLQLVRSAAAIAFQLFRWAPTVSMRLNQKCIHGKPEHERVYIYSLSDGDMDDEYNPQKPSNQTPYQASYMAAHISCPSGSGPMARAALWPGPQGGTATPIYTCIPPAACKDGGAPPQARETTQVWHPGFRIRTSP